MATTQERVETRSVEPRVEKRTTWTIDPNHTITEFGVKHMMVSTVKGRFTGVTGTLIADEEHPENSSFEAEIDAASINTNNEQRDGHLRSADFLDVEKYPKITFKSTRIEEETKDHLKLIGDLTIHGITRPVELDINVNGRGNSPMGTEIAGITAETTLKRQDFDLTWNVPLETGGFLVGDTAKIAIEAELIKS